MIRSIAEADIEKGREQGLQQGIEQGLQQGIEQGISKGIILGRIQVLESLLGLASSPITKVDSRTTDELRQIEADLKAQLANRS